MIKIVTLNIWQEQGPWQERMTLINKRLRALQPDVLCLQEVRYVDGKIKNQALAIAETQGKMGCAYVNAQEWGGGEEGLAILSRFPQIQKCSTELPFTAGRSRRICMGVELEAPEGRFWVFTTHLAWRLADGVLREKQIVCADRLVQSKVKGGVAIFCGDFNASSDTDEMRYLRGKTTLEGKRTYYQDAFAACNPGVPGITWARENPYTQPMEWLELDRRLDYIYVTPRIKDGRGTIHSCRVVCTEPDERGIRCSDHYGVLAEVQVGLSRFVFSG